MPSTKWFYDASTSPFLRFVAHLPVLVFGGTGLLLVGFLASVVLTNPQAVLSPPLLLLGVFLLIGGPISLLYLWPMLTEPEQRPSLTEFEAGAGFPFTRRSIMGAALVGAIAILAALRFGASFDLVYGVAVVFVFSPLLVATVTTHGEYTDEELVINRTEIPLHRISDVRTWAVSDLVFVWLRYTPRSGVFLPRLFVVPVSEAAAVRTVLETGKRAQPDLKPPDRAAQIVLFLMGVLFLGVAALAYTAVSVAEAKPYLGMLGVIGLVFCFLGWRGL